MQHSLLIKSLRFWKIGSLNFGAEQYGHVFATLMLRVVVINLDYRHFKKLFKLEGFLTNNKNHLHRKAFCQFRINAHSLMCEIGRYWLKFVYDIMELSDMEDYFLEHFKSSAAFITDKITKILEDWFIKFWRRTVWSDICNTNAQSGGNKLRL